MLFSENTDKLRDELKSILPVSVSYDTGRISHQLFYTERNVIVPLLGESLCKKICGDQVLYEREVAMCRRAVANITVYENFTLLNTQMLPGGFARITGENTGSLYKYQETELKDIFRRNGYDELDRIVSYFVSNVEHFPEFTSSDYYLSGRGELIPDRMVFSRYYKPVGHIVFRYMQPFIRRVEDLDIPAEVGLHELRTAVLSDSLTDEQRRTLELVRPVVVCLAVAYAVEDMGVNITDAGIWVENRVAGDGTKEKHPAEAAKAADVAAGYRRVAARYLESLQKHLFGGNVDPLRRDNNGKKTVWL